MAQADFERCLANVLVSEGGYSHDKHDPGGATMNGITQAEYSSWRRANGLPTQWVGSLSTDERRKIYKSDYWDKINGDDLPVGLDYCVFDEAVNSGVARARKALSSMPSTDTPEQEIQRFNDVRLAFLHGLSTWRYFGKGWQTRVAKVEHIALQMLAEEAAAKIKAAEPLATAAGPNDPGSVPIAPPPFHKAVPADDEPHHG